MEKLVGVVLTMQAPNLPSNFPPHKWLDWIGIADPYFVLQTVLLWSGTRICRSVAESGPLGVVLPHPVAIHMFAGLISWPGGRQTVPIPRSRLLVARDSFNRAENKFQQSWKCYNRVIPLHENLNHQLLLPEDVRSCWVNISDSE